MKALAISSLVLTAALATSASAGTIHVSQIGGGLVMDSGDLSATVFAGVKPSWSTPSLASAHAAINGAGISTDGKVTIVSADTDHGLALLVLIDRQFAIGAGATVGRLQMDSIADGSNVAYINDVVDATLITSIGASRFASASFDWNANGEGDGFAWANLTTGNTMAFRFERLPGDSGLVTNETFQFVSWSNGNWNRWLLPADQTTFSSTGEFGFTATVAAVVIPLPTTAAMALIPLLGIGASRRRR